jgi:endonuclease-3 related protein
LKKFLEDWTDFAEFNISDAREFHALIDEFGKLYLRNADSFAQSWLHLDTFSPELIEKY